MHITKVLSIFKLNACTLLPTWSIETHALKVRQASEEENKNCVAVGNMEYLYCLMLMLEEERDEEEKYVKHYVKTFLFCILH